LHNLHIILPCQYCFFQYCIFMEHLTGLGITNWRNLAQSFGIRDEDRLLHMYAIGRTGTGKSTLLLNMAISDIQRGNGLCLIDPHGDIAETILKYVPRKRVEDVIYFNSTDDEWPIAFNPLSGIDVGHFHLGASNLVSAFKKIWSDSWGPRLEYVLRFCLLTLLHAPNATLLDIHPLLTDTYYRNGILQYVTDTTVQAFWLNEFNKYTQVFRNEVISPILNKAGVFNASMSLRLIFGQRENSFSILEAMDDKKILICNLSKGQIGEEASSILGSLLLTSIQSAALFRASYSPSKRIPFYVYVDEMHSFVTMSFADMLAESRKYGLGLFLTHQYIEQLPENIRGAIFGNVGTLIAFRIGATDAQYLAKEFHPMFDEEDLVNLPRYSMYLKLMIDGTVSRPFSAMTMPLPSAPDDNLHGSVIIRSRVRYGTNRELVESRISENALKRSKQKDSAITLFDKL
jgi:hypothetical protein